MPAGETIGNGGLMPMPTMGSPIPMGTPTVNPSVFGGNTNAEDYERQLRERAIQERNKQLLQEAEIQRRGELVNTPMVYRDPTTGNFGINTDIRADDDGIERLSGGVRYIDGAQQLDVGGAYYPGYEMDGVGRVGGVGRAELNYQTPNFSFTGGYTSGRRGARGGFGGAANFRNQF